MDRTRSWIRRGARSFLTLSPWGARQPWRPAVAAPVPPRATRPEGPVPTVVDAGARRRRGSAHRTTRAA